MTTLAANVRVGRRFQRSIRVDADIDSAAALDGFVCPPSAAQALLNMARQFAEGQGAFTWTGPYGSGKSSLAVALAALLGGDAKRRAQARQAIGADCADELLAILKAGRKGWITLPVVGRRDDPATAIAEAIRSSQGGGRGRIGKPADTLDKLLAMAADAPGAGLILIIDEMGKFLEQSALGEADVYFFQQLAESASRSKHRLMVIGVLHQAFDDYAHRLTNEARDEWLKIQGRFADVAINVAGEEQIALIARAIEADNPPLSQPAAAGIAEAVRRVRPGTAIHFDQELAACWPLHPVVACLLGPISRRRFGQNQRSVFGFLNSAEPHGFQEFIRNTSPGEAVIYPPALLWDYLRANLEPSILASPDGHRWSLAVEAVERCEARGGDLDHLQLVKTIAIIDLFKERSGLRPSRDVIGHALPGLPAARIDAILDQIVGWSIVIYKKFLGAFAIYAGSDFDIGAAITDAESRTSGVDFAKLRNIAMLQPILAKRHYHRTGALRWFDIDIAPLSDGYDYVTRYQPSNGATGLFLLLVGIHGETAAQARRMWDKAASAPSNTPVAVGFTRDGYMIEQLTRELLALETVRSERSELQGDAVARREVDARIARAASDLEDRLRKAFLSAQWKAGMLGADANLTIETEAGLAALNAVASTLADRTYGQSPLLSNELLNRIRPSSNAIAAQKALLTAMVENNGQERLGIAGYPAHGGLYTSLLERTDLYREDEGKLRFCEPAGNDPAGLTPLWLAADKHFQQAGPAGATLQTLCEVWRAPPFGLRDGLFPVLAIAFILSRSDRLAVYLDKTFQPRLTSMLTDRLSQDPSSVRLRWSEVSDFHRQILSGIAEAIAVHHGLPAGQAFTEPLDIARGLVAVVADLQPWVLKTRLISPTATQVRNLAKLASDPNKFLLDDIPAEFGAEAAAMPDAPGEVAGESARAIIHAVRTGLDELVVAYSRMLQDLAATMLAELRISDPTTEDIRELHARAETVKGLTGNYRLDAFATRLSTYMGTDDDLEGIAGLAANKPTRDWVDRDINLARIEIAALAQEFVKAEGLAHVKGRPDHRMGMAMFLSDPTRDSPVTPEFDITASQRPEVSRLTAALRSVIEAHSASRDIALAALLELGVELSDPPAVVASLAATRSTRKRRVS